jgi:hypothetical protein
MDIEYPTYPSIAIFLLPYLSDALPHGADVIAQATADKEKINEACISERPKSLAKGGMIAYTKDIPRPTAKSPDFSQNIGFFTLLRDTYF